MIKKIFNFQFSIFNSGKQAGMTLFIAVTVMGILLFISFAVTNIVLKGTIFASSGRDSQFAFYAADATNIVKYSIIFTIIILAVSTLVLMPKVDRKQKKPAQKTEDEIKNIK